jgi:hypothetical protein
MSQQAKIRRIWSPWWKSSEEQTDKTDDPTNITDKSKCEQTAKVGTDGRRENGHSGLVSAEKRKLVPPAH